jgi:hypothetical protein
MMSFGQCAYQTYLALNDPAGFKVPVKWEQLSKMEQDKWERIAASVILYYQTIHE